MSHMFSKYTPYPTQYNRNYVKDGNLVEFEEKRKFVHRHLVCASIHDPRIAHVRIPIHFSTWAKPWTLPILTWTRPPTLSFIHPPACCLIFVASRCLLSTLR